MRVIAPSGFVRRLVLAAVIAGTGLSLAGCVTTESPSAVDSGPDVPPGTNEDFIVNVGRRIYFNDNSAELTDTAKVTLDNQAKWLNQWTGYKVKIEGFADEKGSEEFNKQLGLKRAEAARAYLASQGVAQPRMRVKTFGNTRKVKDCPDSGCTSQNRRVITVLDTEAES
jgi:peptidoglycan-associated lipoprotein